MDTSPKTGWSGPRADEHARKVVGLSLIQQGEVPAWVTLRTAPGDITYRHWQVGLNQGGENAVVQDCLRFGQLLTPRSYENVS